MLPFDDRQKIREDLRDFEESIPLDQRKKFGQFFTGIQLGKLLASLAVESETISILDPMAGNGDLLDCSLEISNVLNGQIKVIDGIELDKLSAQMCENRLSSILGRTKKTKKVIVNGDAFRVENIKSLQEKQYDLVITNPPYVRYQTLKGTDSQRDILRKNLNKVIANTLTGKEKEILTSLSQNYSGLSDLSIPSWMLACVMVAPGGRLAVVVPATWRNRNYADVIRYILLRCFCVEFVVEDTQPGWFSDALVRTNLIIARKLPEREISISLNSRTNMAVTQWIKISPEAGNGLSHVGSTFQGDAPEIEFAKWLKEKTVFQASGIEVNKHSQYDDWEHLKSRVEKTSWYKELECEKENKNSIRISTHSSIPRLLKELISSDNLSKDLVRLNDIGIHVGQGLRTGCNKFFYVDAVKELKNKVLVRSSDFFSYKEFFVPKEALHPVIRRQSEAVLLEDKQVPSGRVLDLRNWVLPEDYGYVQNAKMAYKELGLAQPHCMPDDLAKFVRVASKTKVTDASSGKTIPELSAVRTNIRIRKDSQVIPKFWYMLPEFKDRHIPCAFVPRINHDIPWTEANLLVPALIDANFSTFWCADNSWCSYSLKALLNSSWCRAYMEALGTPFGGGALKLEAAHLKQIIVPKLSQEEISLLGQLGKNLYKRTSNVISEIDKIIFSRLLKSVISQRSIMDLANTVANTAHDLSTSRKRVA